MSQVLAISNETLKAPEPSSIQRDDDKFLEIFEKEKIKSLFPSMLSINFQSFASTPLFTGSNSDNEINKIDASPVLESGHREGQAKTNSSIDIKEQKQEQAVKGAETQKEAKAEQVKLTANAMNKIFAGELELSADLYSALITAKNNAASLRKIDVDDLVAQIKNKIKFLLENGKTELSIELKPDNLGTILMSVSSNKGILSINIYAGQAAKQALEENIAELERALKLANLNIDNLKVLSDSGMKHNKGETG